MAGWRARGYVPDSDEEEDSQGSTGIKETVSDEPNKRSGDNEECRAEGQADGHGHNKQEGKKSQKILPGRLEAGQRAVGVVIATRTRLENGGNIDELQDDHYENLPTAQLRAGLLASPYGNRFQETGSPRIASSVPAASIELSTTLVALDKEDTEPNARTSGDKSISKPQYCPAPTGVASLQSSPLSDISSDLPSTQSLLAVRDRPAGPQAMDIQLDSGKIFSHLTRESSLDAEQAGDVRPARSLRHRKAIQLHPYAIEGEKYRQLLHARGVKALRLAQMEPEMNAADNSQYQEFVGHDSQDLDPSSPPRGSRSPARLTSPFASPPGPMDDDFPDVSDILRSPSRQFAAQGYKRRKMTKPTFRRPPMLSTDRVTITSREVADHRQDVGSDVYDVPPSPPLSGSHTPTDLNRSKPAKFHVPRPYSGPTLPTPLTSSEPRRRPPIDIQEHGVPDDQFDGGSESDSASESARAPAMRETTRQLEQAQRRLRGVLPASWLKLDFKSRKKNPEKDRRPLPSASPDKGASHRGIARSVVRSVSKTPSRPTSRQEVISLFDESSSSELEEDPGDHSPALEQSLDFHDDDVDTAFAGSWGEAMEDDRIDAMLPPLRRRPSHVKGAKKRQTTMADFGLHSRFFGHSGKQKPRRSSNNQPRIATQFEEFDKPKAKPRFRPPDLSILDAPSTEVPGATPRFLKLAQRTVRSRHDKGRHSPSRKFIRLATRNDTHDTNQTLRDWREGTIRPRQIRSPSKETLRRPLQPRSANGVFPSHTARPVPVKKWNKGIFARAKFATSRSHSIKPRKLRTYLDSPEHHQHEDGDPVVESTKALTKPLRQSESRKQRGQMTSSLQTPNMSRPAMLETLEDDEDRMRPQTAFRRDLTRVDRFEASFHGPTAIWDRFFEKEKQPRPSAIADQHNLSSPKRQPLRNANDPIKNVRTQQPRKRRPHRVNVPDSWSGQSSSPFALDYFPETTPDHASYDTFAGVRHGPVLTGLGPFGTRYSSSFDATPLPSGTCFHDSTFLGSGGFQRSLKLSQCSNLDASRGYALLQQGEKTFRWGPWNDGVSSELGEIFEAIKQGISHHLVRTTERVITVTAEHVLDLQKRIVGYFSDHLSFLDPVDRVSFLQRCTGLLSDLLLQFGQQQPDLDNSEREQSIQSSTIGLVIANQLCQISQHDIVPPSLKDAILSILSKFTRLSLTFAWASFDTLTQLLSHLRHSLRPDLTIHDNKALETFIVIKHIVEQNPSLPLELWGDLIKEAPRTNAHEELKLEGLESLWRKIFVLLPFFELDNQGMLETGRRFKVLLENWKIVKMFISPVLDVYILNPKGQCPSFNVYCRTLFSRCLYLMNVWGWRRCDSIIGTLFDFFARNNLNHLKNEESHGSPLFLQHLDKALNLIAEPEDRCFHILLKIIGSGLRHLRQIYPEKKIRDIVWRLMPNHGRYHPKDEAIKQEDLDALRNHHDLLATLYWASPPGFRPRLSVIRNLVHVENSHREACHINIRTWSNLVRYQLSTDEPTSSLEPFAEWHNDILQQVVRQHGLARTEAEDQVRSVQHVGGISISKELLELTIAKNQRQVEAVLSDALVLLKLAVDTSRSKEAASVLLSPGLSSIFNLFDSGRSQAHAVIIQALDVILAYTREVDEQTRPTIPLSDNDDSQDYGDWTGFDEDVAAAEPNAKVASTVKHLHEPLRHLLSNCFGADQMPQDALLSKVVQAWAAVGHLLVRDGSRSWNDYIGRFGNETWTSLRDTEQTRKFSSYYLALLIETDATVYEENKSLFLTSWIESMVDRESQLKFQHKLTTALLEADTDNPFLLNLPFWRNNASIRLEITPTEFSERRLSLVSSVLSNMRTSMEGALFTSGAESAQLRQEYKDLLKHLMRAMKQNYQELGHGSNIKGAYVDFIHRVVEVLQQHTSNICPIDRFFTDNMAFPLPATDPTYVVGQLKNYGLRLQDPRTPKQLAVFLHSVSERAAIDGQQAYLLGQLPTAMSSAYESGSSMPTLRTFLIRNIIPAYIEIAFQTTCGWILALPFLQALRKVFDEMTMDLSGSNKGTVAGVASIISSFLDCTRASLACIVDRPEDLQKAMVLKTLTASYAAITTLLPTLEYLVRLNGPTKCAKRDMNLLQEVASFFLSILSGNHDALPPDIKALPPLQTEHDYANVREFTAQEIRESLSKDWTSHDGQYFVVRGGSRREVVVDVGLIEEEREGLRKTLLEFLAIKDAYPELRMRDPGVSMQKRIVSGLEEVFF